MRIALDTNLLVAALAQPRGTSAGIMRAWREGRIEVVASEATVLEAEAVLGGRWLGRMASPERVAALLEDLRTRSVWVHPAERVTDLPLKDAGDLRMLETALDGGASHIVTTDREFLSHRGYGAVEFVTPVEFWRIYSEQEDPGPTWT
jgi:putative PIN family toxin of toxin-antitoxin system